MYVFALQRQHYFRLSGTRILSFPASVRHCHKRQFASSQPRENMADEYRQSLVISNRISTALKIAGLCWTACGQVFSTAAVNTK